MAKFNFVANTIDGKIQQFPTTFFFDCLKMKPQGMQVVREYNGNECIVAINVFLVYYEGRLFGTLAYKSMREFDVARKAVCFHEECYILIDGCQLTFNGCPLVL